MHIFWNSDSEKTQNNYILYSPNSNQKFYMTREWWYLKLRCDPEVEHPQVRDLKALFIDDVVEINLNVSCRWDWEWPLAASHGFSVTGRTTEVSGDKALPPPRDLQAEGGKVLKHTLRCSVWVTLCPHQVHLQGTQNVPPEEMGKEALRKVLLLLLLRLLNTISAAQTGCRFWQSQREIWMNAEFQEWLDWDQHLQGKEILYKLQQMCVFFVRLWFHPSTWNHITEDWDTNSSLLCVKVTWPNSHT